MADYQGVEWCPYCETENEYDVDESTEIVTCSHCGRPLVLCDKCDAINGHEGRHCCDCPACDKAVELRKEWEKKQVGRKVIWHDPDFFDGQTSTECTVVSVDDATWILTSTGENVIEALDGEIEFVG